ncbi:MAG: Mut7-C ubiquitin/RNAse domain-containing protein [Anaerolineaceae bacterium]|nr:Mut7-C ubiquitin/RNAse domain-containing protein [Anaerolineaceae bacterium]
MAQASLRFYGALNYFLSPRQREQTITHHFDWRASVKDMIESIGPPHTEIDLIVANGESIGFDTIVKDGDAIAVYADSDEAEIEPKQRLIPKVNGAPRFILDTHLGRLASYLRMLGYDTLYRNDYPDDELAQVSHDEKRILLTRDLGVLKRAIVEYGYYVRTTQPRQRLSEIHARYDLATFAKPYTRCMSCNGLLRDVAKSDIIAQLPEQVAASYDVFRQCLDCGKLYWKGSHTSRMQALLDDVLGL